MYTFLVNMLMSVSVTLRVLKPIIKNNFERTIDAEGIPG